MGRKKTILFSAILTDSKGFLNDQYTTQLANLKHMPHKTASRAHGLVEELRAEVDFEIDDVIANIIRDLPEEYFRSLAHEVQLTHLKALLAISICNLKRRLTLRSDDDRHIAVISRQNYKGLLAKIIAGLPDEQPLIGAKIFTSITHDFIIDSERSTGGAIATRKRRHC